MKAWAVMSIVGAAVVAGGAFSFVALADPEKPKTPDLPPGSKPDKPADPAKNPGTLNKPVELPKDKSEPKPAQFPASKPKQLYAAVDLRGKSAPSFEVERWLNAEPKRENKVVLIDFWATWCPPCRALAPELQEWHNKFKDDMVVIGVSDEKDADQKILKFMESTKLNYPMAVDAKATMKNALQVQAIPHVMIIDSKGIVRWQGFPQSSEDRLTEATIKQIIEADKAQRPKK